MHRCVSYLAEEHQLPLGLERMVVEHLKPVPVPRFENGESQEVKPIDAFVNDLLNVRRRRIAQRTAMVKYASRVTQTG